MEQSSTMNRTDVAKAIGLAMSALVIVPVNLAIQEQVYPERSLKLEYVGWHRSRAGKLALDSISISSTHKRPLLGLKRKNNVNTIQ